jgi:hypothetical protein
MPLEVFHSYAHEDEALRDRLDKHLRLLQRQDLIVGWHDRRITAGDEWANQIDEHIRTADIILLLISADFIASRYCYEEEMQIALTRHQRREAVVIPIILRPVDWKSALFGGLQALPRDAKPITAWANQDEAFVDIAEKIREAVLRIQARAGQAEASRLAAIPANPFEPKPRVFDAGIPGHVVKGEPAELLVMIRLPDSAGLIGKLLSGEETGLNPGDVLSKNFTVTFPAGVDGSPQPLKVRVELTSPDFSPAHQAKNIIVPPNSDSEPCKFMLVPTRLGKLKLLVELQWEDAMRGQRSLVTECVAIGEAEAPSKTMNVVQIPIVVETRGTATDRLGFTTLLRGFPPPFDPKQPASMPESVRQLEYARAPRSPPAQSKTQIEWDAADFQRAAARTEGGVSYADPVASQPTSTVRAQAPELTKARRRSSGMIKVVLAAIAAVPIIVGSYWQFVYKPQFPTPVASQGPNRRNPILVSGYVINAKTNAFVPDALVTLNFERATEVEAEPLRKYTDSNGSFHFILNEVKPSTIGRISVHADNFNTLVQDIVLANPATPSELRITPLENSSAKQMGSTRNTSKSTLEQPTQAPGSITQSNSGGINVLQGTTGPNSSIIDSPINIGSPNRTITEAQKKGVISLLGPAPLPHFQILCDPLDSETCKYARQLADLFTEVDRKWAQGQTVTTNLDSRQAQFPKGVFIFISPKDASAPPEGALRIQKALEALGASVPIYKETDDDPIGKGNMELVVSNMPRQQ